MVAHRPIPSVHCARTRWLAALGGLVVVSGALLGFGRASQGAAVSASVVDAAREEAPAVDPRVQAFVEAYASVLDSVEYGDEDVVFTLAGRTVHFRDGRMLAGDRLDQAEACDPLFYSYPLEPLTEPLPRDEMPRYCTHVLETLWGATEREIRAHGRSVTFLDHRMFLNGFLVDALAAVERDLRDEAGRDPALREWIDDLEITYSFISREIAGSPTRSHHAWGMALDLVPSSYEGRQVYWRWSRVLFGDGWDDIPMEQRWSPPQKAIDIFERHGFVWGGKWAHFDQIHFEYRPEIVLYNRLVASTD